MENGINPFYKKQINYWFLKIRILFSAGLLFLFFAVIHSYIGFDWFKVARNYFWIAGLFVIQPPIVSLFIMTIIKKRLVNRILSQGDIDVFFTYEGIQFNISKTDKSFKIKKEDDFFLHILLRSVSGLPIKPKDNVEGFIIKSGKEKYYLIPKFFEYPIDLWV